MMHKVIAATTLALSPMLLHAQANVPVQSQTPRTVHVSRLVKPGSMLSSSAADSYETTSAPPSRVSSGIVAPKLIHTTNVTWLSGSSDYNDKVLVVHMNVDATGKPKDLKIVQSSDPAWDENVLESVNLYRFTPGTLNNLPVTTPLDLHVTVHSPSF